MLDDDDAEAPPETEVTPAVLPPAAEEEEIAAGPIKCTLLTAYIFFTPSSSVSLPLIMLLRGAGISATRVNAPPSISTLPPLALGTTLLPTVPGGILQLKTYINTTPVSVPTHTTPGIMETHRGLPRVAKSNEDGL
jgi:hypothetical protein